MSQLKAFLLDPDSFDDVSVLVKIAKEADKAYYNTTKPKMTDKQYDLLREKIKHLDPDNKYLTSVGSSVTEKVKVKLPYHLGSMDKPNASEIDKFIKSFKTKFPGPYMISAKLDGVSALLGIKNKKITLYTRGDGTNGTDITNLSSLTLPSDLDTSIDYYIRGELIMSKDNFKKYSKNKANARNTVSGVVNAKTIRENEANDTTFVGYEVLYPWQPFDQQLDIINNLGIEVVENEFVDDFNREVLIEKYRSYTTNSPYECDGIIISFNSPVKRNISGNPKYSFAFKNLDDLETKEATVIEVLWQVSKDGYINPVLSIEPITLGGVTISRATAFNAKYIYDNNLGPKAKIEMVRSGGVIPYIKRVIKGAREPQMPDLDYEWNSTEVDIITTEYSTEQKVRELEKFFKELKIKHVALKTIEKFVENNIDTIPTIMSITKKDLSKLEGFKDTMINKIYDNIHQRMETITMPELMVASNIFGHGLGPKMLNKIYNSHPDIIEKYMTLDEESFRDLILSLEGFAVDRTEIFLNNIQDFVNMLDQIPNNIKDRIMSIEVKDVTDELTGKKFVFTGFRNKEWEKLIIDKGGEVTSSVSSKTYAVVADQSDIDEATNAKIKKAISLNITIMNKEEFEKFIK